MKLSLLLPLAAAALASGLVLPDDAVMSQIAIESKRPAGVVDAMPDVLARLDSALAGLVDSSRGALDRALGRVADAGRAAGDRFHCLRSMTAFDAGAWLSSAAEEAELRLAAGPDRHGRRGRHGRHGHHGKANKTIYELIAESKYTTKLAKLVADDADLVAVLNGTAANYTLFAPTDAAFARIPKHHGKPSKELIRRVLLYHVSPDFYPAGRVLVSHTIPSLLKEKSLGDEPQRLRVGLSLRGLTVNFFSRVVAVNIFASNGVIHGVDHIILPPPSTLKVIELFPGEYSTLELGLHKTGLFHDFSVTAQTGGTFFAPSNFAFQKLGPKINAFLFSSYGEKYLKGLLKYHVVSNTTLYSDAYYPYKGPEAAKIPKGKFHVDLPTLLEEHYLAIDVARFGGFISVKINGFTEVSVQDGVAQGGVIHALSDVLIPPKKLTNAQWQGEELTIEDLKERLEPFVDAPPMEL